MKVMANIVMTIAIVANVNENCENIWRNDIQ